MKSNRKRVLLTVSIILCALLAVGAFSLYPRRLVSDVWRLVPSERLRGCARVVNAAAILPALNESRFYARLRAGDIPPVGGEQDEDSEFAREWAEYDPALSAEFFGRDCIGAFYGDDKGDFSGAVWTRIGVTARFFHAVTVWRTRLFFWRKRDLSRRVVEGVNVFCRLERKTGDCDYSYVIHGDCGIAVTGFDEGFWRAVASRLKGGGEYTRAHGVLSGLPASRAENATGVFFLDFGELAKNLTDFLDTPSREEKQDYFHSPLFLRYLADCARRWPFLSGEMSIGKGFEGELLLWKQREGEAVPQGQAGKNGGQDPLAPLYHEAGLLYASFSCDTEDGWERVRRAAAARGVKVSFFRDGRSETLFPEEMRLSWVGDGYSLFMGRGEENLMDIALSVTLLDRARAEERLGALIRMADGAVCRVTDGGGRRLYKSREEISLVSAGEGDDRYWHVLTGSHLEHLYRPAVAIRGDRLIAATSGTLIERLNDTAWMKSGEEKLPPREGVVLKGKEIARAAKLLGQALQIAGIFVRKSSEEERLERIISFLALAEWLEPVREAKITVAREEELVRLTCNATFADVE